MKGVFIEHSCKLLSNTFFCNSFPILSPSRVLMHEGILILNPSYVYECTCLVRAQIGLLYAKLLFWAQVGSLLLWLGIPILYGSKTRTPHLSVGFSSWIHFAARVHSVLAHPVPAAPLGSSYHSSSEWTLTQWIKPHNVPSSTNSAWCTTAARRRQPNNKAPWCM